MLLEHPTDNHIQLPLIMCINLAGNQQFKQRTIPESGMTEYLVHVTRREKRHPWVEQYSQKAWEPTNCNNKTMCITPIFIVPCIGDIF